MIDEYLTLAELLKHEESIQGKMLNSTVEALRQDPNVQHFANAPEFVIRYAENLARTSGNNEFLMAIREARVIMGVEV